MTGNRSPEDAARPPHPSLHGFERFDNGIPTPDQRARLFAGRDALNRLVSLALAEHPTPAVPGLPQPVDL